VSELAAGGIQQHHVARLLEPDPDPPVRINGKSLERPGPRPVQQPLELHRGAVAKQRRFRIIDQQHAAVRGHSDRPDPPDLRHLLVLARCARRGSDGHFARPAGLPASCCAQPAGRIGSERDRPRPGLARDGLPGSIESNESIRLLVGDPERPVRRDREGARRLQSRPPRGRREALVELPRSGRARGAPNEPSKAVEKAFPLKRRRRQGGFRKLLSQDLQFLKRPSDLPSSVEQVGGEEAGALRKRAPRIRLEQVQESDQAPALGPLGQIASRCGKGREIRFLRIGMKLPHRHEVRIGFIKVPPRIDRVHGDETERIERGGSGVRGPVSLPDPGEEAGPFLQSLQVHAAEPGDVHYRVVDATLCQEGIVGVLAVGGDTQELLELLQSLRGLPFIQQPSAQKVQILARIVRRRGFRTRRDHERGPEHRPHQQDL